MDQNVWTSLAIATALGLLVGLQREWHDPRVAGIRTFTLITLLGSFTAFLSEDLGGGIFWAGLVVVAVMLVFGEFILYSQGRPSHGITTEVAALLMYCAGGAVMQGHTEPALAVGGATAVLLHWKTPLHQLVGKIGENDLRAIMQLVLIALVIFPVLPNTAYGPYQVLNPHEIWLMVLLIVGLNLAAYLAYKIVGAKAGGILGGVFGGMISSTATTVSFSRQSHSNPGMASMGALVILIASAIVNLRILVEVGIAAPSLLPVAAPPFVIMVALMGAMAGLMFRRTKAPVADPDPQNPARLHEAFVFGLLYGIIIFAVAAAKSQFGTTGIYVVALVSGLTDVDAITLSTAQLAAGGRLAEGTAWRVILAASLSNLAFKGAIASLLGDPTLRRRILLTFGVSIAAGVALIGLWPQP